MYWFQMQFHLVVHCFHHARCNHLLIYTHIPTLYKNSSSSVVITNVILVTLITPLNTIEITCLMAQQLKLIWTVVWVFFCHVENSDIVKYINKTYISSGDIYVAANYIEQFLIRLGSNSSANARLKQCYVTSTYMVVTKAYQRHDAQSWTKNMKTYFTWKVTMSSGMV